MARATAGPTTNSSLTIRRYRPQPRIPREPSSRRVALSCVYQVEPDGYGSFTVEFENLNGSGDQENGNSTFTTARFIIEDQENISLIADNDELGIFGGGTLVRQTRRIR